jgi:hypothetical protein
MRLSHNCKRLHNSVRGMQSALLLLWVLSGLVGISVHADELKPETAVAFERYIGATEARMANDIRLNQFLVVDRLPDSQRQEAYDQLHRSQIYIEELHTQQDHHSFSIPNGLIHHWAGVMFIPNATLSETIAVIEDYDNETIIYKPEIRQAKLVEDNGNESKIYLQFVNKSIVTVVLNVISTSATHDSEATDVKLHPAQRASLKSQIQAVLPNTNAATGTTMGTCGASTTTGESKRRMGAYMFKTNLSR